MTSIIILNRKKTNTAKLQPQADLLNIIGDSIPKLSPTSTLKAQPLTTLNNSIIQPILPISLDENNMSTEYVNYENHIENSDDDDDDDKSATESESSMNSISSGASSASEYTSLFKNLPVYSAKQTLKAHDDSIDSDTTGMSPVTARHRPTPEKDTNKIKRKVNFCLSVKVILIPTRDEFKRLGLFDSLYYNANDFNIFKQEAFDELTNFIKTSEFRIKKKAMKHLGVLKNFVDSNDILKYDSLNSTKRRSLLTGASKHKLGNHSSSKRRTELEDYLTDSSDYTIGGGSSSSSSGGSMSASSCNELKEASVILYQPNEYFGDLNFNALPDSLLCDGGVGQDMWLNDMREDSDEDEDEDDDLYDDEYDNLGGEYGEDRHVWRSVEDLTAIAAETETDKTLTTGVPNNNNSSNTKSQKLCSGFTNIRLSTIDGCDPTSKDIHQTDGQTDK